MTQPLKAQVQNGRLVLDDPSTDLPDGTEVELYVIDDVLTNGGDYLDDEERKRLHEALEESVKQAEQGQLIDAEDVMAELRSLR
ncbi:MAG: hypothetical protein JRI68_35675 [Deltaproteobacteria bacterium]|nr:hypothetical protein [Deltaproteobacteria bacterium]